MQFVRPRDAELAIKEKTNLGIAATESGSDAEDEPKLPKGWASCSSPSALFQLHSITLSPDPPRRSNLLRINIRGNLAVPITTGLFNYTVRYGIIPIVKDSMELCDALRMEPRIPQCPLRSGAWDVTHTVELPKETPFGRYSVEAAAWHADGREIFCLKGTTVIGLLSMKQPRDADVQVEESVDADNDKDGLDTGRPFEKNVMQQVRIK